jgi:hypothetical protein
MLARQGALRFMDVPDVPLALELCGPHGLRLEPLEISYFLSREKGRADGECARIVAWRDRIFAGYRAATRATSPTSSTSRPIASSSWGRGSKFDDRRGRSTPTVRPRLKFVAFRAT